MDVKSRTAEGLASEEASHQSASDFKTFFNRWEVVEADLEIVQEASRFWALDAIFPEESESEPRRELTETKGEVSLYLFYDEWELEFHVVKPLVLGAKFYQPEVHNYGALLHRGHPCSTFQNVSLRAFLDMCRMMQTLPPVRD